MSDFTVVKLLDDLNIVNIPSGLVPKGAYDNATDYAVGDSVDYLGSSYVMFVDAAAGTLPTDTTKWQVLAIGHEKASGAEIDTGTDDLKYATPKAITDSKLSFIDGTETLTNKTLTSPKINENVVLTSSATELNLLDGITVLSGNNTGDNATNSQYSGLAASKQDALSGTGFVKIAGTTISYDNSTYLTALTGAVLVDQTVGQTIGLTGARLTKLWATDITVTNAITGSVTGNAGTVTTNANLTGVITSVGNATSIASQTGTGTKFVVDTSPTIVTPTIANLIGNKIYPASDSTTAIQINKADNTTNVLNIDTTNGRVGIGTTSPTSLLHLYKDQNAMTDITIVNPNAGTGAYSQLTVANGTGGTEVAGFQVRGTGFAGSPASANQDIAYIFASTGISNGMGIMAQATGAPILFLTESTEKMRITSGGNVGIGTTGPTNILSFGGNSARKVWLERHSTSNTAGNILTIQAGSATTGATDKAGGNLILIAGLSTGTGESGVQIQGCPAGSTGTTDSTPVDVIKVLGSKLAFYNQTPIARAVLATGAGATVDNVITALQNLGLVSQS